jgi:hypothetical protein
VSINMHTVTKNAETLSALNHMREIIPVMKYVFIFV